MVYKTKLLCMSEQEFLCIFYCSIVTFPGRLSGVFIGVRMGYGTCCNFNVTNCYFLHL